MQVPGLNLPIQHHPLRRKRPNRNPPFLALTVCAAAAARRVVRIESPGPRPFGTQTHGAHTPNRIAPVLRTRCAWRYTTRPWLPVSGRCTCVCPLSCAHTLCLGGGLPLQPAARQRRP